MGSVKNDLERLLVNNGLSKITTKNQSIAYDFLRNVYNSIGTILYIVGILFRLKN